MNFDSSVLINLIGCILVHQDDILISDEEKKHLVINVVDLDENVLHVSYIPTIYSMSEIEDTTIDINYFLNEMIHDLVIYISDHNDEFLPLIVFLEELDNDE